VKFVQSFDIFSSFGGSTHSGSDTPLTGLHDHTQWTHHTR